MIEHESQATVGYGAMLLESFVGAKGPGDACREYESQRGDAAQGNLFHKRVPVFLSGRWKSQEATAAPAKAPISWATTKARTLAGAMPEKVSVKALAMATAGLAKEVEAVNQ